MPELTREEKLRLLTILLESRHGDLREQNLNRQGKGHFHVSGMGHEALAAISFRCRTEITSSPTIAIAHWCSVAASARGSWPSIISRRRKGESHGRQMPSHYSCAEKHIWSVPTPTGSQLLPACGMAWGIKLDGKNSCCRHDGWRCRDAARRFLRSHLFREGKEIAGACSSSRTTPTASAVPPAKSIRAPSMCFSLTIGRKSMAPTSEQFMRQAAKAFAHMRAGKGPVFFWVMMERLSSHTSSDDQKLYRSAEELRRCEKCDPLKNLERAVDRGRRDQRIRLRKSRQRNQRADSAANLPTRKRKKIRQPTSCSSRSPENFRN